MSTIQTEFVVAKSVRIESKGKGQKRNLDEGEEQRRKKKKFSTKSKKKKEKIWTKRPKKKDQKRKNFLINRQ